jgi:hypothetical protein
MEDESYFIRRFATLHSLGHLVHKAGFQLLGVFYGYRSFIRLRRRRATLIRQAAARPLLTISVYWICFQVCCRFVYA